MIVRFANALLVVTDNTPEVKGCDGQWVIAAKQICSFHSAPPRWVNLLVINHFFLGEWRPRLTKATSSSSLNTPVKISILSGSLKQASKSNERYYPIIEADDI